MAEIFQFPGKGGVPKKADESPDESRAQVRAYEEGSTSMGFRTAAQVKADCDWVWHSDNRAKQYEYRDYGQAAINFIDHLKGYIPTKSDIKLRRAGMRGQHISELIDIMLDSDETKWREHPSYYQAIRIEINERATLAKHYPPEGK